MTWPSDYTSIPAIKQPLHALQVVQGWDWIHFNRLRKSAVDYMGTFEELSSPDVGSSCPWSLRAQFHWLIAGGGNKNKKERKAHAEAAAERCHVGHWWLAQKPVCCCAELSQWVSFYISDCNGRLFCCKLTSMAAGEEKQLWRLTNTRIKAKLLYTTALVPCVHPRVKTDTERQRQ